MMLGLEINLCAVCMLIPSTSTTASSIMTSTGDLFDIAVIDIHIAYHCNFCLGIESVLATIGIFSN